MDNKKQINSIKRCLRDNWLDVFHKELDLTQAVINRMADCSFKMKGWAVMIVSALFVLLSKIEIHQYKWIVFVFPLIPLIFMAYLDALYLRQERLYRTWYDYLVSTRLIDTDVLPLSLYALNPKKIFAYVREKGDTPCKQTFKALFSKSVICFYLPLALVSCLISQALCFH